MGSLFAGFLLALWASVPIHELLHAAGCALTGGRVWEVHVAPLFGGTALEELFPWITATGSGPGRLTGFAPSGDISYLVTVLLPHITLVALGAALCRTAVRRDAPALFGAGLAGLGQPLAALGGDMYEAAAIPLTRIASGAGAHWALSLRGDDAAVALSQASAMPGFTPAALVVTAVGLGFVLAIVLLLCSGGVAPIRLDSTPRRA